MTSYTEHTITTGYDSLDGPVQSHSGELYAENNQEEDVWEYGGPNFTSNVQYEYMTDVRGRVGENGVEIIGGFQQVVQLGSGFEEVGKFDVKTGTFNDYWSKIDVPDPDYCDIQK